MTKVQNTPETKDPKDQKPAPTIEQLQKELEEKNNALAAADQLREELARKDELLAAREQQMFEQKESIEELEAKVKGSKARETVKIGKVIGVITCERFIDVLTKRTVTAKELAEDKEMCARLIKEKSPIIKIVKK